MGKNTNELLLYDLNCNRETANLNGHNDSITSV